MTVRPGRDTAPAAGIAVGIMAATPARWLAQRPAAAAGCFLDFRPAGRRRRLRRCDTMYRYNGVPVASAVSTVQITITITGSYIYYRYSSTGTIYMYDCIRIATVVLSIGSQVPVLDLVVGLLDLRGTTRTAVQLRSKVEPKYHSCNPASCMGRAFTAVLVHVP